MTLFSWHRLHDPSRCLTRTSLHVCHDLQFQGRTGGSAGEGVFNTRRIPFGSRIRVVATFTIPSDVDKIQSFFFIIRGLEALHPATFPGIIVAGLQLPPTARLKLYTTTSTTVKALDYLTIANVSSCTGGMLHDVWVNSPRECLRSYVMKDSFQPIN